MRFGLTNVNKYLIGEQRNNPAIAGDFSMLISDVVRSCKAISQNVSLGKLTLRKDDGATVPQYGTTTTLKETANQIFLHHCEWGGHLAAISSAEMDTIHTPPSDDRRGNYLLLFDALDGSSNIDVNLSVGSIFSVLRCPEHPGEEVSIDDFLQPGVAQVAAGYALYGASTILVLTIGSGTHGFTLDREIGEFLLTHPHLQIPEETHSFAINASKERFWEPPIRRYVDECLAGQSGIRGKDFNMRWAAAMVADVHRILMRGGIFLYPRDTREPGMPGRTDLLHKANPMAMIIEQAGGLASTGYERISTIIPQALHQRTPIILGSRAEVERIDRYHAEYANGEDKPFSSPLFSTRSLFRTN